MGITQHTVCILTVTYGNRWQFLEQVLKRAAGFEQVGDIIVVDNASVYDVAAKAKTISDKITTITDPENLGSAGGYKMALEYGVTYTKADFFLLLDDDNVPDEGATRVLLDEWDANLDVKNTEVIDQSIGIVSKNAMVVEARHKK